jgi:hypothetical protein
VPVGRMVFIKFSSGENGDRMIHGSSVRSVARPAMLEA